jgi:hypothetical protein
MRWQATGGFRSFVRWTMTWAEMRTKVEEIDISDGQETIATTYITPHNGSK